MNKLELKNEKEKQKILLFRKGLNIIAVCIVCTLLSAMLIHSFMLITKTSISIENQKNIALLLTMIQSNVFLKNKL